MSDFIRKAGDVKASGLGPKAQKLAALREKAAKASAGVKTGGADTGSVKGKVSTTGARKTAFQRKAT